MGAPDQHQAEDVARRAREEMREATANLRALLEELRGDDDVHESPLTPRASSAPRQG